MNTSVPVVVFACGPGRGYGALGVARSLGRRGVRVYVVGDNASAPVMSSRYWHEAFTWNLSAPVDQSLRFLRDIGRRVGSRPILLHTTDRSAVFVAENASALEEVFIFPKLSPTLVESLTNKWQMFLLAEQNGIPTPKTVFPRSRDDVLKFLDGARFPIMLKGADALLPHGRTKRIVNGAHDLLELYDRAADAGAPNLMVQEYIPGGDDSVWMCNAYFDRHSNCLAAFTGRKIRQSPPYAGVASLAIWLTNEVVEETTRHFLSAVGYQGLVGIGYRYDTRDGLYKVLDVNPRLSAVFRLFVAKSGTDVAEVCYLDLTGQAVPPLTPTVGRKWMLEDDIFSSLKYWRDGKLTLTQWLRSLRGVQEMAWFAPDDLKPFIVWLWKRFRTSLRNSGDVPEA